MEEATNPFAGAEIITSTPGTVPPPAAPAYAPGAPRNPKSTKVPRAFVDENTGSVVEIAKKDQTFLRHYAELGREGAAKYANISGGRADHILKLPAIQQYLRNALQAVGVTDTKIATRIAEGLDATVPMKQFVVKNSDGSSSLVDGKADVPDLKIRGEYVDRALRVQGMDSQKITIDNGNSPLPTLGALASLSPEELTLVLEALKRKQARAEAEEAEVVEAAEPAPSPTDGTSTEPPAAL